ncbi:hypothetical protein [Nakamurella sp.]|uniref:hypothetical protein n=1 Tax=Nakamurella sp. TaxID=1869182 RepID=UPI003B3AA7C9
MSASTGGAGARLFDLLPAVYRERDARPDGQPGFLESLLGVIADQLDLVTDDLADLYDDLFVETCRPWVLPYIGDLVAVTPGAPVDDDAVLTRAAVTDAIGLRRRKGTAAVLEQLARDQTGWPALAVEMFNRLTVTQHLRHVVPTRGRTLSLRSAAALEQVGRSFDPFAHTLEVRRIGDGRGRYAVPNVAIMVWRDRLMPHTWSDAHAVDARRFRFSPLGIDQPLITRPRTEQTITHRAGPIDVPGPVTRRAMAAATGDYYGVANSVAVRRPTDPDPFPAADVVVCNLSDNAPDGSTWSNAARLAAGQLAIDPQLGRLAFGADQADPPTVTFLTGQPSDTGGSELRDRPADPPEAPVFPVRRDGDAGAATTVTAALAAGGGAGTVLIDDSRTYTGDLTVTVPPAEQLRLVGRGGAQPVIDLPTGAVVTVGERGALTLFGLVLAGGPLVVRGRPDRIEVGDCTFVPGGRPDPAAQVPPPVGPSIVLELDTDWQSQLVIDNCVTGPLLLPADSGEVTITDSIVDGVADGLGRTAAIGAPGRPVPALRSPTAPAPLNLSPASSTLNLTLGTDPARLITLSSVPTDIAGAAALLDAALVGTGARAIGTADRVVLIGDGRPLSVDPVPGSDLADGLGLVGAAARARTIVGGPADPVAAGTGGAVSVADSSGAGVTVVLPAGAADLPGLAGLLEAAVRAADPRLAAAAVGVLDNALVLIPPGVDPLTLAPSGTDPAVAAALGLVSPRPAIAGDPSGGSGATVSLIRSTVLGSVAVTAVALVQDSIVTGTLTSDRRQIGCLEYSWIAPGSSTARRHECQPASADTPPPRFVSTRFGTPGYARLRRAGASALIRAASDGYEMGALARLRQTQRDDNLRRAVAEFLRFGLEAGVLDGT